MKVIKIGERYIYLLGTVQGLLSEKDKVRKAYLMYKTDAIAVGISTDMLGGLRDAVEKRVDKVFVSNINEIFARKLSAFGEVQVPPPSLAEAFRISKDYTIPIIPIDMDEDAYQESFTKAVSGLDYYRHISRVRKLEKKKFKCETPEEFVLAWDRYLARIKGFAMLEWNREVFMADKLRDLSKEYKKILAVVEYEREEGVAKKMTM